MSDVRADILKAATAQQYPALKPYLNNLDVKSSPQQDGRMLEYWPKGETDSFNPKQNAVELFDKAAKPQDLAGDLVSHQLVNGENTQLSRNYQQFIKSMTPEQHARLQEQYQWAQKNEGETRPYKDWAKASGLPAYYRGYAFGQWPNRQDMYTPEQLKMFDGQNAFLKSFDGGGD